MERKLIGTEVILAFKDEIINGKSHVVPVDSEEKMLVIACQISENLIRKQENYDEVEEYRELILNRILSLLN